MTAELSNSKPSKPKFPAVNAVGNGVFLKRRDQIFSDPAEIFGAAADK